ncbi:MAG: hypothetical protein NTV74_05890 [Euryarchaeota archaeon]|nr:hypothetical protein [Euryarchaeota archaeon]
MKNVKKNIIIFGAVVIVLLMASSATAVPAVNGKALTTRIEKSYIEQKEYFINQLITIYDQLKKDGVIDTENQELQNIDLTQDFDQSFYIDVEGFVDYITSNEFIQLLNENYNDIVSNIGFQLLWNTGYVQEYVQSEEFTNFMNTDEVQYILDNLDIDSGNQQVIQTRAVNVNSQVLPIGLKQESALKEMSQTLLPATQTQVYNTQSDETLEGNAIPASEENIPALDLVTVWIIILIGLISWIPAIIFVLLTSPIQFILNWITYMCIPVLLGGIPWPFPFITAILAFVWTMVYIVANITCWPVIWMYFFEWWAFLI